LSQTELQSFSEAESMHRSDIVAKDSNQQRFTVVAYNTHLLPNIAAPIAGHRSNSSYRATEIARQLVEYDLVALSELFDHSYKRLALDMFQSESGDQFHVAEGPSRSGRHLIGSGLVLLSRYPIVESHRMTFRNASRFLTSGFKSDGFAAKGVLHAKVLVDEYSGVTVDCFLTHLESQSIRARDLQLLELKTFIEAHSSTNSPSLIMGDFNVVCDNSSEAGGTPYESLLACVTRPGGTKLNDVGASITAEPQGTSDALAADGGRRIDYIFLSNSTHEDSPCLIPYHVEHKPLLDSNVPEGSLSDHLAVSCELKLSRNVR
jgi:endonuclease/exonuclease/phosphatase family metal-dependent hydrolase